MKHTFAADNSPKPDRVTGYHYELTEADFSGGCIVTNPLTRVRTMSGTLAKTGRNFVTRLDTPLCEGCDNAIGSDGYCAGCNIIHTDIGGQQ